MIVIVAGVHFALVHGHPVLSTLRYKQMIVFSHFCAENGAYPARCKTALTAHRRSTRTTSINAFAA